MSGTYWIVNDTRYDNHHGCLTVIRNLENAMRTRGWSCGGALPVGAKPSDINRYLGARRSPDLVIVNGEGSLHDEGRNCRRLLAVCHELQKKYPVVLVNALWENVTDPLAGKVLRGFRSVYTRDRQSQQEIVDLDVDAGCAPDLTFLSYPSFNRDSFEGSGRYLCTDSVVRSWSDSAYQYCSASDELDYLTMFTPTVTHKRGISGYVKSAKNVIYPRLYSKTSLRVPPKYRALTSMAFDDTYDLLVKMQEYDAICVARFHALCFAIQQGIPFLVADTNSRKSISLLAELGMPEDRFTIARTEIADLPERLEFVSSAYNSFRSSNEIFCVKAAESINSMFDQIIGSEQH